MNFFGIVFTLVMSALMLSLPRNWAPLPLLLGAVYLTRIQQFEIGPMHFPVMRVLIVVGFLRVIMNRERMSGGMNSLDRIVMLWSIWNICSIAFHRSDVLVGRLGDLYDTVGAYYLFRVFVRGIEDVRTVFKIVCVILVPLAVTMLVEKLQGVNPLGSIGFGPVEVQTTKGHFRAQGAFGHPILAGTVGAVCLPMAFFFWRENRKLALVGVAATLAIVFASGSSGPVMTIFSVVGALALWKVRGRLRAIRWLAVFLVVALSILMNDPVYFLMGRIDITGGSTGYFRAQLIRSGIDHLSEWWFAGTDHTRHWMPTGITADPNHTDMTNYYLQMGVWGGLPLILLFVWMLVAAFLRIGKALRTNLGAPVNQQFLIWSLGSILFGHATTFWSISYFDQTIVFLCLVLACIGSLKVLQRTPAPILSGDPTYRDPKPLPARS
jgi:O-antigen ligase